MWNIERLASAGKYTYAYVPDHPNANRCGYVYEHRIQIENSISRLLTADEVVHHINGDRKDNRIKNLAVMSSKEHAVLHGLNYKKAWVKLKCPICNIIFIRARNVSHLGKSKKSNADCCGRKCGYELGAMFRFGDVPYFIKQKIKDNVIEEFSK